MCETILEVITCSVADAIEAEKGGAGRLEIVRDLDRGGLTPSVELVRAIKEAVDLPLRVMVRESDGYQTSGEAEIVRLCAAADEFARLDVDGLVLGFLNGKTIDLDLMGRILAAAPRLKATFHHAFEDAADQLQAISEIKKLSQVDRILSHGGSGNLEERGQRLDTYVHAAAPAITIIAGGRIDRRAIALLRHMTPIREFHVGRAARREFRVDGEVQSELVRALVDSMNISSDAS
jgi:copper homeostasis protein